MTARKALREFSKKRLFSREWRISPDLIEVVLAGIADAAIMFGLFKSQKYSALQEPVPQFLDVTVIVEHASYLSVRAYIREDDRLRLYKGCEFSNGETFQTVGPDDLFPEFVIVRMIMMDGSTGGPDFRVKRKHLAARKVCSNTGCLVVNTVRNPECWCCRRCKTPHSG